MTPHGLFRVAVRAIVCGLAVLASALAVPAAESAACCGALDPGVLRNMEYAGILDNAVTLKDGIYEGEPFVPGGAARRRVEFLDAFPVLHDLDGDGSVEAAVLLAESSGGSGIFTWMAVVACRDGSPVQIGVARLGDRVMIRAFAGRDGAVVVDLVVPAPDDPLCCPTRKVRYSYRLRNGNVRLASSEEQGPLALGDLEGVTWRLSRLGRDGRVPEGVNVTAMFGDGRVSGSGGCNRYSAAVSGTGPLALSVGPAASTRMACPEPAGEFERSFLTALQAANRFGFLLGRLVLHYRKGDTDETMTFGR